MSGGRLVCHHAKEIGRFARASVSCQVVLIMLFGVIGISGARATGNSMETLIPDSGINLVALSPTGRWVAAAATRGQLSGLLVQAVGSREIVNIKTARGRLVDFSWIGPDALLVTFDVDSIRTTLLERLSVAGGKVKFRETKISAPGWLAASLPLVPDTVIWAFDGRKNTKLRRVLIEDLVSFREESGRRKTAASIGEKVAESHGYGRRWVIDRKGNARAYLRIGGEEIALFARESANDSFVRVHRFDSWDSDRQITPVAMAEDGINLLVIAYAGGDTLGLHVFDVAQRRFAEAILVRPDVDLKSVLVDDLSGAVIAGVYEVDGQESNHYLENYQRSFLKDFDGKYAADQIQVLSSTLDQRFLVFRVAGPTNPGDFYFRDRTLDRDALIAQSGTLIDRARLAPTESLTVESEDGTQVEAFLTIPRRSNANGPRNPLVVMPHGGPIGVRDNRAYDPLVQYLASWGFAVLQPNYRGSSGYGRKFEHAGRKEWARGIEDDIDAAVEAVLIRPEIDGNRVCVAGGSYGGFSALASIIRHRDRYQCAISWNGVSDIPLMSDSSDIADYEKNAKLFAEAAGDVEQELDRMIESSPVYQIKKIETPVFLIYGTKDRRVDPDHSHRVLLMLETLGKPFDVLEVEEMAHSPTRTELVIVARAMRRFLTRYLTPSTPFLADPLTEKENKAEFQPRFILGR